MEEDRAPVDMSSDPDGEFEYTPNTVYSAAWPFESLRDMTLNLKRLGQRAIQLSHVITESRSLQSILTYARFVICGRVCTGDPTDPFGQIRLDVQSQTAPLNPDDVRISYDIDSLIALVEILKMKAGHPLAVYSVVDFKETLRVDNHLKCTIRDPNDRGEIAVPPHHIPNFCAAKIGRRGKLVVLLPKLYKANAGGDRRVPKRLLEIWYDQVIRPAMYDLDAGRVNSIPVSYKHAEVQQRDDRGRFHFSTFDVPGKEVGNFCRTVRHHAQHIEDFRGLIFLIEFRGTKGASRVLVDRDASPEDIYDARIQSILDITDPLDDSMFEHGACPIWLDVAAEYFVPGMTLLPLRSAHSTVLQTIFPQLDSNEADLQVEKAAFTVDVFAQIDQIAGFRSNLTPIEVMADCEYVQCYTTLKSFHYALHPNSTWQRVTARDTLPDRLPALCHRLSIWMGAVHEAMDDLHNDQPDNQTGWLDGAVRVEARVPWQKGNVVLAARPSDDELRRMFLCEHHRWIWVWIWARILGIYVVLDALRQCTAEARSKMSVGALAAVLVSMLNAIFYREQDEATDIALREGAGRRTLQSDDPVSISSESPSEPVRHGAFFISDLWIERRVSGRERVFELPRGSEMELSMAVWLHAYGVLTIDAYNENFPNPADGGPRQRNPNRTNNRRRGVTLDVNLLQDVDTRAPPVGFNLGDLGVVSAVPNKRAYDQPGAFGGLRRRVRTQREVFGDSDSDTDEPVVRDPDEFMEKLWRQWPVCVFDVASNVKDSLQGSHMKIPIPLRHHVTTEWFKGSDLRGIFAECRARKVTHKEWGTVFDHFFPNKGWTKPTHFQHYEKTNYFGMWRRWTTAQLTETDVEIVRKRLREEFNQLSWVPLADSGRIWNTRTRVSGTVIVLPPGFTGPAVQIALNPRFRIEQREILYGSHHPEHPARIAALTGRED